RHTRFSRDWSSDVCSSDLRLERLIDTCQKDLPPLKEFVLPGGSLVPSLLHLARTICRRAERHGVRLSRKESAESMAITYLNRLRSEERRVGKECKSGWMER